MDPSAASAPFPPDDVDLEVSRSKLFAEGRQAAVDGRWEVAATRFRDVVALRSAPRALIALAVAEQELGHMLAAKALLLRAARDAEIGLLTEDRIAVDRALTTLIPTIPRIRLIRDPRDPKQLGAVVDGKKAFIIDDQIELEPGAHQVSLRALDYSPQRFPILIDRGETLEVHVELNRQHVSRADDPPSEPSPDYLPPVLVGAGGAVLTGLGFTLMGLGVARQDEARELCGGRDSGCPETARYAALSGRDEILAGDVLAGVGGAAVLGSVAWIIAIAASDPEPPSPAAATTARGLVFRF